MFIQCIALITLILLLMQSKSPKPLPLNKKFEKNALRSSEILTVQLTSVQEVLNKYIAAGVVHESKVNQLALQLARECFFGPKIMVRCTPKGGGELPALPQAELYELKQVVFKQFPQHWRNPASFEGMWKGCLNSIEQACKRLRW